MLSEQQFYEIYTIYSEIIDNARERIITYKKQHKIALIPEQEKFIEDLEYLKDLFHKQYHWMLLIDNKQGEVFAERKRMLEIISKLTIENENLKQSIK